MFGFYIRNNIGIAFRTFASGIFAGLGSVFFLALNGVFIGVAAGQAMRALRAGAWRQPYINATNNRP